MNINQAIEQVAAALRDKVDSMDHHGTVEELRIERGRGYSEV